MAEQITREPSAGAMRPLSAEMYRILLKRIASALYKAKYEPATVGGLEGHNAVAVEVLRPYAPAAQEPPGCPTPGAQDAKANADYPGEQPQFDHREAIEYARKMGLQTEFEPPAEQRSGRERRLVGRDHSPRGDQRRRTAGTRADRAEGQRSAAGNGGENGSTTASQEAPAPERCQSAGLPERQEAGEHYYPGCEGDTFQYTSDCAHGCGCWMGSSRSGGPDGVDPFGKCPKAPAPRQPEASAAEGDPEDVQVQLAMARAELARAAQRNAELLRDLRDFIKCGQHSYNPDDCLACKKIAAIDAHLAGDGAAK